MNPNTVCLRPDLRARLEARFQTAQRHNTDTSIENPPHEAPLVASEPSVQSFTSAVEDLVRESEGVYSHATFDPRYPHFAVQSNIRDLLFSALCLSKQLEIRPGVEERQRKLKALIADYEVTCKFLTKGHSHAGDNS